MKVPSILPYGRKVIKSPFHWRLCHALRQLQHADGHLPAFLFSLVACSQVLSRQVPRPFHFRIGR